jgi:hypothetical protein
MIEPSMLKDLIIEVVLLSIPKGTRPCHASRVYVNKQTNKQTATRRFFFFFPCMILFSPHQDLLNICQQ